MLKYPRPLEPVSPNSQLAIVGSAQRCWLCSDSARRARKGERDHIVPVSGSEHVVPSGGTNDKLPAGRRLVRHRGRVSTSGQWCAPKLGAVANVKRVKHFIVPARRECKAGSSEHDAAEIDRSPVAIPSVPL